jgi:hypothetical protein
MYVLYATPDSRTVNKLENKIKIVKSAQLVLLKGHLWKQPGENKS